MRISVRTNVDELHRQYAHVKNSQMPFATMLAINRTLEDGRQAITQAISSSFDSPTSWAMKGVRYWKAEKNNPTRGRIFLDDFAGKGIPAYKFLSAEVYGGPRRLKRSEVMLRERGLLPEGYFAVPGSAAPLDGNGNIPGNVMVQVLSVLQAFGEQGYKANLVSGTRADKRLKRAGVSYFVGRPGKGLPLGIWERRAFAIGSAVRPFMVFVRAPVYSKRLHFYEIWQNVARVRFPAHMEQALQFAMKTARR